ncbi:MAG: Twitching mobility protein [Parcubacteria group bacterium ADurb.Bin159]|nr:MAG: Twitching mobility protein [Parcubacteria group bacterium ADurb.Bin159]
MTLDEIFKTAVDRKASDVHLMADEPVVFRINGILIRQNDWPVLKKQEIFSLAQSVLDERAKRRLEKDKEADLSYEIGDKIRFRINLFWQKGGLSLAARVIWPKIPTLEEIRAPLIIYELLKLKQGLILVTGPTGCGKSTTLAAMVDWLDNHYPYHIITLEDPIEFSFTSHKSLISQREMGKDFVSFAQALRHIVRQDPNVIMVGEMRDLETISLVTTLAETGHLILATLHTPNAPQTIDRIVDVFPSSQQPQIRLQLALCLKAIIAQQLVPHLSGGRIAAREVMINTPAVATLIRENKIVNISNVIQTGAKDGMQTMDQDLEKLYQLKQISRETLQSFATYPIN